MLNSWEENSEYRRNNIQKVFNKHLMSGAILKDSGIFVTVYLLVLHTFICPMNLMLQILLFSLFFR